MVQGDWQVTSCCSGVVTAHVSSYDEMWWTVIHTLTDQVHTVAQSP